MTPPKTISINHIPEDLYRRFEAYRSSFYPIKTKNQATLDLLNEALEAHKE